MIKKTIQHPNGFKAVYYDKRLMIIYTPEGRECLQTEFGSVQTDEEIMERLEEMPDYLDYLESMGLWRSEEDD